MIFNNSLFFVVVLQLGSAGIAGLNLEKVPALTVNDDTLTLTVQDALSQVDTTEGHYLHNLGIKAISMVGENGLNSTDSEINDIKINQTMDNLNVSKFSLDLNTIDESYINDINTSTSTNHLMIATEGDSIASITLFPTTSQSTNVSKGSLMTPSLHIVSLLMDVLNLIMLY